ncbi:hypothetical protein PMSD_11685 [Paenibacillus macquariensis subsp. defensor]|nr:hypothetical protein PMSD_11685 [Paenibacillus macquariensis subsp. defensor]
MTIGFPKPTHNRIKPTQKQMGEVSKDVSEELENRSKGICELCEKELAVDPAHLTGRKQLDEYTKVTDLLHLCRKCHNWLDGTPEGIRCRRFIARAINTVLQSVNK